MNLYLLHSSLLGYDTFSSAVVTAPDEETARTIHPDGEQRWNGSRWRVPAEWDDAAWTRPEYRTTTWAAHPDEVEVTRIGVADQDVVGVVLASFHSG